MGDKTNLRKLVTGSEAVLGTQKNDVSLTWNNKLERETVFAHSKDTCKKKKVYIYNDAFLKTQILIDPLRRREAHTNKYTYAKIIIVKLVDRKNCKLKWMCCKIS